MLLAGIGIERRLGASVTSALLFAGTVLVTTPGALLEPTKFFADVAYDLEHYAQRHVGYTVEPGASHLGKILECLLLEAPSTRPCVALFALGFGLLGLVACWRDSRRFVLVLLAVPVLYVPCLATQKVMFVCNLLLVMPIAALLSTRGVGYAWDLATRDLWRGVVAIWAGLMVIYACETQVTAAETIRDDSA